MDSTLIRIMRAFFNYPCILGDAPGKGHAEDRLSILNATLGQSCEVRLWILLFKNKPYQAGEDQEAYWRGGNKNEFTVCIGTDAQNNVTWCKVISWTDTIDLKVDCRNYVRSQKKLDLEGAVDFLSKEVPHRYKRKHFADFNYITVDPPLWMTLLTYFLVVVASVGASAWAVCNDIDENGERRYKWRYKSRYY